MVIASPSPMSLDGLAKRGQAALLASGRKPKLTHMLLPTAGEAELLRYDQPFKSPIGPLTLTHLCYMCLRGGKKYLLSFAFLPDDTESEIQAEQMATTWRLGRAPVAGSR
jgi:hypothetical protein